MHLGSQELLIVLAIVLLLFGAKRIPELAKGLGQGIKEFKKTSKEIAKDEESDTQNKSQTDTTA